MKVNWNDIERPESSGSFPYRDGTITVRQEEIDVWRMRPDALFTVRAFRLWTNKPQYALASSYELPNERQEGGTAHMKVTWEDIGCPDGPGTYAFKDGTINVSPAGAERYSAIVRTTLEVGRPSPPPPGPFTDLRICSS